MATGILIAVVLGLASQADKPETSSPSTFLAAVADGFDANRAKFSRGNVAFDYQDGFAQDPESARQGKLTGVCTASGVYIFDVEGKHPRYRYNKEFSEADAAAQTVRISDSQTSTRLDSFRAVSSGALTLFDQIHSLEPGRLNHTAEIQAGCEVLFRRAEFPFELGFPETYLRGMSRQIRMVLNGEKGASVGSVEESAEINGRPLARFTLKLLNGDVTYIVDPERGWTPIEKHVRMKDGSTIDTFHDDARRIPGRGWLAFVKTVFRDRTARRIVVQKADFETVPKPSDFDLEFDEPRQMVNTASGLWYRKPRKIWNLASLPSASSSKTQKLDTHREPASSSPQPPSPELPGERAARPWYLGPVALGVFGVLGAATLVLAIRARR